MTAKKTDILFELGKPQSLGDWLDYSVYQFDQTDVAELIELVLDEELAQADSDSNDVWVPLHAWRILGQLQAIQAITPLVSHFEQFEPDDWAFEDLPIVLAMIGEPAMPELVEYFNNKKYAEDARAMAMNALAEMVKITPALRDTVLKHFCDYMLNPDLSAMEFNGLLVSVLLDLEAAEHIALIRQLFAKDCVALHIIGDIEDVEIEFGLRTERDTPRPNYLLDSLGLGNLFDKELISENASYIRETPKVGRNEPCPCGSGKKFKKCCLQ